MSSKSVVENLFFQCFILAVNPSTASLGPLLGSVDQPLCQCLVNRTAFCCISEPRQRTAVSVAWRPRLLVGSTMPKPLARIWMCLVRWSRGYFLLSYLFHIIQFFSPFPMSSSISLFVYLAAFPTKSDICHALTTTAFFMYSIPTRNLHNWECCVDEVYTLLSRWVR